jgi:hypothetical protein
MQAIYVDELSSYGLDGLTGGWWALLILRFNKHKDSTIATLPIYFKPPTFKKILIKDFPLFRACARVRARFLSFLHVEEGRRIGHAHGHEGRERPLALLWRRRYLRKKGSDNVYTLFPMYSLFDGEDFPCD